MAQQPDIRVRLSPEGVEDVIAGLRRLRKEGDASARKAGEGVGVLSQALAEVKRALPALGLAAAITGTLALGKSALTTADNIGKMGSRVGAASENLSVLDFAATALADTTRETLERGLVAVADKLKDLRAGAPEAAAAFSQLGLSAQDFAGRDTAQAFDLVAQKIAALPDGLEKTQAVIDIFGRRAGPALINLLNTLGSEGFDKLRAQAERLGLIFSTDLTKAAEAANDSMTVIGKQVQGLAVQFVSGLAPSVAEAMVKFREATEGTGVSAIRTLGHWVGLVFAGVVKTVLIAGETIGLFFAQIERKSRNLKQTVIDLSGAAAKGATGGALIGAVAGSVAPGVGTVAGAGFGAAAGAITGITAEIFSPTPGAQDQIDLLDEYKRKIDAIISSDPAKILETASAVRGLLSGGDAEAKARTDTAQRLAQITKQINTEELKDIATVAKQRREIRDRDAEVARAEMEARLALNRNTSAAERERETAEVGFIRRKLAAVEDAYRVETQLARVKEETLKASVRRQYADVIDGIKITETDEKKAHQQIIELVRRQGEAQRLTAAITRQSNQEQLAAAVTRYAALKQLQAEFEKRATDARTKIIALDQEVADNAKKTLEFFTGLERAKLPEPQQREFRIQDAGTKELELQRAALTGNTEKARELRAELNAMGREIAQAGDVDIGRRFAERADELHKLAADANKLKLGDTARDAASGVEALKEKLKPLDEEIKRLQATQIDIKVGVEQEALRALITGIREELGRQTFQIGVTPVLQQAQGGLVPKLAEGGRVPGASPTPYADNIPILATAGEFMQPVKAVRYYGTDFMESVRRMELPKYAAGGLVGDAGGSSGGGRRDVVDVNLRNGARRVTVQTPRDNLQAVVDWFNDLDR